MRSSVLGRSRRNGSQRWRNRNRSLIGMLLIVVFAACADGPPTREELEALEREFDAYHAENSSCTSTSECSDLWGQCPLPCAFGIRTDRIEGLRPILDAVVDYYERGGKGCHYDCDAGPVACESGRCIIRRPSDVKAFEHTLVRRGGLKH